MTRRTIQSQQTRIVFKIKVKTHKESKKHNLKVEKIQEKKKMKRKQE